MKQISHHKNYLSRDKVTPLNLTSGMIIEFNYKGKLNFKPFYSLLAGNADELNLSYVFNSNAIIVCLILIFSET